MHKAAQPASMKPPAPIARWWALAEKAASAWLDDYAPSMGAALSYYTVFSLAPTLLIVIAVAGLVFGQEAARGALFEQLNGLMGAEAAKAVQAMLAGISKPSRGSLATAIGIVVLVVGATSVFSELQDALDRIWRVPTKDKPSGIWALLRTRFLSFGMILAIAFLLIVSLVIGAVVSALGKWWSPAFGGWEVLAQAVTFVFGLLVTTVGFALIYKLMPRAKVQWHDVWIGAAVTSLLFSLGRFLISLYIGKSGIASGFGAAGSLAIVFVWVYYSAQIFLLGAEFTWVYATSLGSMKDVAAMSVARASASPNKSSIIPKAHTAAASFPAPATFLEPACISAPLARDRTERIDPATATIAAAAVMAGFALRYGLPWLLRRLSGR